MAFTETSNDGTFNGTTPVTIVAAPAASTRRVVRNITIQNRDTASVTLTIRFINGANTRQIWQGTLSVGDTLFIPEVIVLDSTSKSVTGVMSGAPTTTNPDFTAHYADVTDVTGDFTLTDTYANIPGSAGTGALFFPSDGFSTYRYSGSAWVPWGPVFPLTEPVNGDFAWVNQGSATVTTTNGGVFLLAPSNGGVNSARVRAKSVTAPFTIDVALMPMIAPESGFSFGGVFVRNASAGTLETLSFRSDFTFGLSIDRWNSPTSVSGGVLGPFTVAHYASSPVFIRMADDGTTNRTWGIGRDGINFHTILTVARTTFLTADSAGIFLNPFSAETGITLISWKQT